jgi:hypothetical protein
MGYHSAIRRFSVYCVSILSILIISGCQGNNADRAAIETILKQRQQALSTRDSRLYLSLISRDYMDKGVDYQAKTAELVKTLASFDKIEYRSTDLRIDLGAGKATVTANYGLKVTTRGKELKMSGKEEIKLRKEDGGWRIVAGL